MSPHYVSYLHITSDKPQFLDFNSYPAWSKAFIKSIETSRNNTRELQADDKLTVKFTSMTINPIVTMNKPSEFRWFGSALFGAFAGEHAFQFFESNTTPGGTTFVHKEDFRGILTFLVWESLPLGKSTKANFETFNKEIRARAESLREHQ